ncbi:YeiH family protein [Parafilimonas sp.]|uniref:YeiH family protein n=1 Tax=Parafilimonas sp. TaxID=1969739 RepID=UPI0039E50453
MNKQKLFISEDWVAVILAAIIIVVVATGIYPVQAANYNWENAGELSLRIFTGANLMNVLWQFVFVLIIAVAGAWLTRKPLQYFMATFTLVYIITVIAMIIAGNGFVKTLNLETVIFSLAIGLFIGNIFSLPPWLKESLSTELFVKVGLVLLGCSIIFSDILKAGVLGLVQALFVVVAVWYFAYWVCRKLKIDNEMTMMLASAVSICGVSAAIATAGAIKGDTKKLSYVISLVLVTAVPMMIAMPYIAAWMGLSQEVTGAWLGGTIDTTGAVVASGTMVGETALKISTIVKFSQNVLLGIAAFAISVYWTYSKAAGKEQEKPTLKTIWERFPKFVIGFIAASVLFSFVIDEELISQVKNPLKHLQSLWFALAFTSIGLETRFSDLANTSNRKPLYAFLIAQLFNVIFTLIIALLLFR